jgi:uncharacterized protein (UPF0548 family)
VAIRFSRPTEADLAARRERCAGDELTYSPVGVATAGTTPDGFRRGRYDRALGTGDAVFEAAKQAIRDWQIHRGSGLIVSAAGPPAVSDVVAVAAPLPLGFIEVVCRVVSVTDEPDRFGFAYGTLPVHPAKGEESFVVERSPSGEVTFVIDVVSRPHHPLTRLAPPVTRLMQRQATQRYLDAMQQVSDTARSV